MKDRHTAAVALALVLTAAAATVSDAAWTQLGGDPGRSGASAMDTGGMPLRLAYQAGSTPFSSPVISTGATTADRRIAFTLFEGVPDEDAYVSVLRLSDGASVADVDIDDENAGNSGLGDPPAPTTDPDPFGPDGGVTPVVVPAPDGGAGQIYAVHNDDNQKNSTDQNPFEDDIAVAQVDAATGELVRDVSVKNTLFAFSSLSDGFTVQSSPVVTGDLGEGRRQIFFVASDGAGDERLFRVTVTDAGSQDAAMSFASTGDIDANPQASPALVSMRDPASGFRVPMVAVPTMSGLRTQRINNMGEAGEGPSVDLGGPTWTPSVPVQVNGVTPARTPVLYVATEDAGDPGRTVVSKIAQDESDPLNPAKLGVLEVLEQSPGLPGTPSRSLAVAQLASSNGDPRPGRVLVSTSANVFSLDTEAMDAATPPRTFSDSRGEGQGFTRTAPATAGGFAFISSDAGDQFVVRVADARRVPADPSGFEAAPESLNSVSAAGQPAISNGFVVMPADNGLFAYLTDDDEPPAVELQGPASSVVKGKVPFTAAASDNRGIDKVVFTVAGKAVAEDKTAEGSPPVYAAEVDTATLPDGEHEIAAVAYDTARNTPGADPDGPNTAKDGAVVTFDNFKDPAAALRVSPNPVAPGQTVLLDAGASTANADEPGDAIARYEFDVDGDGTFEHDGTSSRVSMTAPRVGSRPVAVRVTDSHGDRAVAKQTLEVTATGRPTTTTGTGRPAATRRVTGLSATVTPRRDASLPYVIRAQGRLTPPASVRRADACRGRVAVQVKRGQKTVSSRTFEVGRDCRFRGSVMFRSRARLGDAAVLRVVVRFQGNTVLLPRSARVRQVRIR